MLALSLQDRPSPSLRSRFFSPSWLVLLFAILCPVSNFLAQTNFGTIVGTISDASGASIPGAKVVLTNRDTGIARTTESQSGGSYSFVSLLPGSYDLRVEANGFKSLMSNDITVQVSGTSRVSPTLTVGGTQETVTVTDSAPLLQTDSSSLGGVVEGRAVLQMPINGRNVNNLLLLVPGVIAGGGTSGNVTGNTTNGAITNGIAYGNYQIGGGFGGQSAFFLDGVQTNVSENNTNTLIPTQDSVKEFRVSTNDVSAEYGGFAGGVVNIATKSGGDQYHGTAYEYFRNSALNANDWFSNHNGTRKPPARYNQFGMNIGGPILKQRTFFFFGWERGLFRNGYPSTNTVPLAAEFNGDFSGVPGTPIYDLSTAGTPQFQCNGVLNVICPSRLDPAAVAIVKQLYPKPLQPATSNNYVVLAKTGGSYDQFNGRMDQTFGAHSLFARYTYWNPKSLPSDPLGTRAGVGISGSDTHQAILGDTYIINPKTVADLRVSYLRFYMYQQPLSNGFNIAQFGPNYGALATAFGTTELPGLSIAGYNGGASNSQLYWTNNVYNLLGSVTRVQGRHTLKFGASVRKLEWNTRPNNQGLSFTATAAFTANGAVKGSGNALASFLLGTPLTSSVVQVGGAHQFYFAYGGYALDTYQATKKLTFNLGLRWDQPSAYTEKNNNETIFDPNAATAFLPFTNPVTGSSQSVTGGLMYVATAGYPSRRTEPLHWLLFGPRVGFAYRATDTTVFHAGYGISYLPSTLSQDGPTSESINSATTSLSNIAGSSSLTTISNPFPNGIVQPPRRNGSALPFLLGQAIYSSFGYQPYANVQQWNAQVEQAFGKDTSLSIAYAGNKGTHLLLAGNGTQSRLNTNQIPDQYLSLGAKLANKVPNPFYGTINAGPLSTPTVAEGYLLLPHPQYQQVYEQVPHLGASTYHALQVGFQRHFAGGGLLGVAYTWSKIISNTDSVTSFLDGVSAAGQIQDNYNLTGERATSLQNIPQNFVANYGIDLPIGHGKRLLRDADPFVNGIASGWRVNGITTFHSGQSLAMLNGSTTLSSSFGAAQVRPNYIAGCQKTNPGGNQSRQANWFNKACFVSPGSYAFGSESRVDPVLRAAGVANWDFSTTKATPLNEKLSLEFSAEFFNIFNRVQFAPPDTNLANAASTYNTVTSQLNNPRNIQFALRLNY